jgi:uncharacterized protein YkwD
VAHPRLVISLGALCLCACAGISPAYGSYAVSARARPAAAHGKGTAHRAARCARRSTSHSSGAKGGHRTAAKDKSSSFHANKGHRRRHAPNCGKRRAGGHHTASTPHNLSPAKPPANQAPGYGQTPLPPAGSEGACPDASLSPNNHNIELIRTAVLCLVNRERVAHGESALRTNARLQQAAQAHTESMVSQNYLEHVGPQGDTPIMRMRAAGYIYSSSIGFEVGENIGWGTLDRSTPRAVVAAWMASPGHRANILDAHFRDTAVGVSPHPPTSLAHNQPGGIYTQDFGVITTG